jgi:hypothetical protein
LLVVVASVFRVKEEAKQETRMMQVARKQSLLPASLLNVTRRFGGTRRLNFLRGRIRQARSQHEEISKQAACYLKMEMTCFSETSVDFQQTKWRYIPEERNLQVLNFFFHLMLTDLTY